MSCEGNEFLGIPTDSGWQVEEEVTIRDIHRVDGELKIVAGETKEMIAQREGHNQGGI